jgi:hypothetical protein
MLPGVVIVVGATIALVVVPGATEPALLLSPPIEVRSAVLYGKPRLRL